MAFLPRDDEAYGYFSAAGDEQILPPLRAFDWLGRVQHEAQLAGRRRKKSDRQKDDFRFALKIWLSTRRLLVSNYGGLYSHLEVPIGDIVRVGVRDRPDWEQRAGKLMRKLYKVEVAVVEYTDDGVSEVVMYDAGANTEPFARRLWELAEAARSLRSSP